jgi:serine/threonine-protein kinase
MGIAVHPGNGRIYVADTLNDRIVELQSADGTAYSVVRSITGAFRRPTGVAIDDRGRIFVADSGNDRVLVMRAGGRRIATITQPGPFDDPHQVAVDGAGRLFVSDTYRDRVLLYRP